MSEPDSSTLETLKAPESADPGGSADAASLSAGLSGALPERYVERGLLGRRRDGVVERRYDRMLRRDVATKTLDGA